MNESGTCFGRLWQERAPVTIHLFQCLYAAQQRIAGTGGAENESSEKRREEFPDKGISFNDISQVVLAGTVQIFGNLRALAQPIPTKVGLDRFCRINALLFSLEQNTDQLRVNPRRILKQTGLAEQPI